MAVYKGIFGNVARYVRADNMGLAIRAMRRAFGFAPRGYISMAGDNAGAQSIGSPILYDTWANNLEGSGHRVAKAARVKSRATHANGKGAAIPQGLNILQF